MGTGMGMWTTNLTFWDRRKKEEEEEEEEEEENKEETNSGARIGQGRKRQRARVENARCLVLIFSTQNTKRTSSLFQQNLSHTRARMCLCHSLITPMYDTKIIHLSVSSAPRDTAPKAVSLLSRASSASLFATRVVVIYYSPPNDETRRPPPQPRPRAPPRPPTRHRPRRRLRPRPRPPPPPPPRRPRRLFAQSRCFRFLPRRCEPT